MGQRLIPEILFFPFVPVGVRLGISLVIQVANVAPLVRLWKERHHFDVGVFCSLKDLEKSAKILLLRAVTAGRLIITAVGTVSVGITGCNRVIVISIVGGVDDEILPRFLPDSDNVFWALIKAGFRSIDFDVIDITPLKRYGRQFCVGQNGRQRSVFCRSRLLCQNGFSVFL